jgi:hypothetical protein
MQLTSIDLRYCLSLTDKALEYLEGMSLTRLDFSGCDKMTQQRLDALKKEMKGKAPSE